MSTRVFGSAIRRREDPRLITGTATYTDDIRLPGTRGPAPYFVNYVTDQLVARYGGERVFGGGLEVTTTIDLDLQEKAREAIQKILKDPSGPAAALVAIDPRTGAVKAMFGGTNYRRSQFNLATQAERQPGSSFKPIVLASAFCSGIAPSTEFVSKPVDIDAGDRIWPVSNYEGSYLGQVDLWQAMIHSDNSVYAQLTQVVGPKKIVATAHALGIHSKLPAYFAIGLGSVAVNPLDMTRAYATIANDGKRIDGSLMGDLPRVVDSVVTRRSGKVRQNEPVGREVLPQGEAETLTSILEDVVQQGTGTRAQIPGRDVAGKTGTTDDYGDAWFVGYTPELAVAVWVGYPDALRPMQTEFHGEPVSGGTLPAGIVRRIPIRVTDDDHYFGDHIRFEGIPIGGYTRLYEHLLDHPNIIVELEAGSVLVEGLGGDAGEWHRPPPGAGLGRGELVHASDLDELLGYVYPAPEQVDTSAAQPGQLAPAEPAVGTEENKGAVARVDSFGERRDLSRCQESHLLALDLWQPDALGWVGCDHAGADGGAHGATEELVRLDHRGRRLA